MPTSTFVLFLLIAVGLVLPAIWGLIRSVWFQERRYDKSRNKKVKPVGSFRYRHLWVVDRDLEDDEGFAKSWLLILIGFGIILSITARLLTQ